MPRERAQPWGGDTFLEFDAEGDCVVPAKAAGPGEGVAKGVTFREFRGTSLGCCP